ncbi:unnamed protein product [Rhizophagus irregularis]|nr:unnamed protein product [Rhizophagus irregularis]
MEIGLFSSNSYQVEHQSKNFDWCMIVRFNLKSGSKLSVIGICLPDNEALNLDGSNEVNDDLDMLPGDVSDVNPIIISLDEDILAFRADEREKLGNGLNIMVSVFTIYLGTEYF